MVQVVLHIGFPKCASTFLQTQVFPKMKGVQYKKYYNLFLTKLDPDMINLFSSESLAGNIVYTDKYYRCDRYELLRRMKLIFTDAKIILITRDRKAMMQSSYRQYIRGSYDTLSFDDWVTAHKDNSFDEFFDFTRYIKVLRSVFNDVCVCKYELLVDDPQFFVKCICDFVGVPMVCFDNILANRKANVLEMLYYKLRNKYNLRRLSQYHIERKIEGG